MPRIARTFHHGQPRAHARATALLVLLPAFALAGAPASWESALEPTTGECAAAEFMRVELLQKSHGAAAAAALQGASSKGAMKPFSLVKSVMAVSSFHVGKSLAFKRYFLPVMTEQEFEFEDNPDDLWLDGQAIRTGAALPDSWEFSSSAYDNVAWNVPCGKAARTRFRTVLGGPYNPVGGVYGLGMSMFMLHGIYAAGSGTDGTSSHREVGGLLVRDVERVFQEELGDLEEFSPWMNIHVGFYDNDLDSYAHRLLGHGVKVLALRWPGAGEVSSLRFYSLIVHIPDTQEIFEIISATAPSEPRLVLKDFPMARHVFGEAELRLLTSSTGPTQLHVSRTHYDLDAVKSHYNRYFQMKPVCEERDAATGVGFVSFWHQSVYAADQALALGDVIRVQVMYWNTPEQSAAAKTAHTTEWLERSLEQLNAQHMTSYTSCWPVWGDNHYTISKVTAEYFNSVKEEYDEAGIGYMLFKYKSSGTNYIFTGYFPMPGGMYIEMQPVGALAPADALNWVADDCDDWETCDSLYCYAFDCAA